MVFSVCSLWNHRSQTEQSAIKTNPSRSPRKAIWKAQPTAYDQTDACQNDQSVGRKTESGQQPDSDSIAQSSDAAQTGFRGIRPSPDSGSDAENLSKLPRSRVIIIITVPNSPAANLPLHQHSPPESDVVAAFISPQRSNSPSSTPSSTPPHYRF
ncbi:hypothetical protein BV898_03634 [Hypsibius exemplaris]|uniref:Uncharacterized protein n=1 Tax=Hypsibius exemplaris TaxID=2072580 RepID=A0A1W0X524_HYPEX|nr:hypothetical protein BV898_03634 [Hypsibius exemplaris]